MWLVVPADDSLAQHVPQKLDRSMFSSRWTFCQKQVRNSQLVLLHYTGPGMPPSPRIVWASGSARATCACQSLAWSSLLDRSFMLSKPRFLGATFSWLSCGHCMRVGFHGAVSDASGSFGDIMKSWGLMFERSQALWYFFEASGVRATGPSEGANFRSFTLKHTRMHWLWLVLDFFFRCYFLNEK